MKYKDTGFTIEKLPFITYVLGLHRDEFDLLEIIGRQHTLEIEAIMRKEGKKLLCVDSNHRRLLGLAEEEKLNADMDLKVAQMAMELPSPHRRATYVNLTGDYPVIEFFAKRRALTIAIVTGRAGKGGTGALQKAKEAGAEIVSFGKRIHLAVFKLKEVKKD